MLFHLGSPLEAVLQAGVGGAQGGWGRGMMYFQTSVHNITLVSEVHVWYI